MKEETCYRCGNVITRDFRGVAVYCAGCGHLENYDEEKLRHCSKCDCYCGCHPCEHTV